MTVLLAVRRTGWALVGASRTVTVASAVAGTGCGGRPHERAPTRATEQDELSSTG